MANTYTQIYIHLVFAVKNRESLLRPKLEKCVHKMLSDILQNNGHKIIAIGGMPDHIHIVFSLNSKESLSNLVKKMKTATTIWINGQTQDHFCWQRGYGAFSYSRSQIDAVAKYVINQKRHHTDTNFRNEYLMMLQRFEIEYDERYVFDWIY